MRHACDTRATRVGHACACTKFYVRARVREHYAYVIPLLISWASVIAKEAPFSSVYCYCIKRNASCSAVSECLPRLASRPKIACALAFASLHPMLGRTYVRTLHARAAPCELASYARQHCQSSSADIPATYVHEYIYDLSRGRDAIELVLSTVKYLQRAHASYMYIKSA